MHMSQPSSGCNTWVNNLVHLHKSLQPLSLNIHNSQHPTHLEDVLMSTDPDDYATHDYLDFVHMAFDMLGPTTDDFEGTAKTFGLGPMFMDKFNSNQFSNLQASNLPEHESYRLFLVIVNSRALRGLAELLPGRLHWCSMEITPLQPTKHPVHIIHEPWIQVSSPQSLGYVTNIIFKSFRDTFTSIAPSYSASFNQGGLSEDSLVSLYDNDRKCWNWELRPPPVSDSHPEQPGPLASELPVESEKLCFEKQVALFLNAIRTTTKSTMPSLSSKPQHQWMVDWSRTSLQGSTGYSQKPDLILVNNTPVSLNKIMWLSPKVIAKYSKESFKPASHLGKMMDTKAYLTLVDQPWRCYVLGLSITDSELLQLHFYNHSGGAISPSINIHTDAEVFIYIVCAIAFGSCSTLGFDSTIEISPHPAHSCKCTTLAIPLSPFPSPATPSPHLELGILPSANPLLTPVSPKHIPAIGRIQVNKTFYEVLDVLFSSTGFLGRGTVCYLACYNGEYYIIKDYWVEELEQRTALHKVNMMKLVQDIDGVPKLQHYWVIKVKLGIVDKTEQYHDEKWQSCMKSQRTHVQLAMKPFQQQALKSGVLHRDCSINNTMIKDFANGLCSFLLDWEFAVWVTLQGEYDLGSTEAITRSGKTNVPSIWKNDIESLFYIFIWILILYDGPLGHEHQDISHEKTLLGLWSEKVAKDLKIARCTKFTFLNDPSKLRLDSKVLQYFQDLIPLANEWHVLLGQSLLSRTAVQFSDVISLFDHFLASMPYKKPPEMMNAFQQIIAQHKVLNSSMCLSQENNMDVMSSAIMSSKCLCEECFNSFAVGSPPINLKESQSVATAGLHHSEREGAGSGGRAKQSEQIGTALEGQATQLRKSTDLPNNSIVNPLAPLPTQQKKGGGCSAGQNAKLKSNVTPPPYMPPIVNGPSPADMPLNPIPQSSTAVATPVFHQHPTDSHHFGFSVLAQQPGHIMPPGMEPDLQVLNNPYIAVIQGDQVPSNTSHPPTPQPNYQSRFIPHQPPATIPDSCIDPSLDSSLSLRQTSATTDICHKSSEKLSSEGSSEESESSSNNPSDTEAGEVSSDEFDNDEDDAFGWGATNLRQSTHPGFSQEMMTSNPIHHNSLPPDHEFQYSCNKDDNAALRSLQSKDKAQPEGSQHGTFIDILECHHHTNSHPVPNHDLLTLVHDSVNKVSQHTRAPHNSKKAKDEGPLPSQLRFYEAVWKDCLEDANLSTTEALITVIIEWNQCSVQFEDGYWPDHKQDMACLLLGDMSTWHLELKLVTLATTPSTFNLIPPSDVAPWVHVQWIETTATKLLDNSLFLQDGFDKNIGLSGKNQEFHSPHPQGSCHTILLYQDLSNRG
ncbi:hypothetical protein F5J12DRAFT_784609 [Pisolithus orientalis]|uniref:uncharacterized protein n=1 Tax=Pisolithus orientalis TaxID=936130 RepID=UPI00222410C5|nr:uncharacterized protein F5J12DRAFT_784609 [Pisolithus orientalis]KAI5999845.1 hypothetical protein F5J12DRAFT_784609 [Pisolithus orientalis]